MDRRVLISKWLQSKNYAPEYVAIGLLWLDRETEAGRSPSDSAILAEVDEAQEAYLTGVACKIQPDSIGSMVIEHSITLQWRVYAVAFTGSFLGSAVSMYGREIYAWIWS